MDVRTILFPTDFSESSRAAFAHAVALARELGAELHLLHVLEVPGFGFYDPMGYIPPSQEALEQAVRSTNQALAALAADPSCAGLSVVAVHKDNLIPGPAILAYARAVHADLVVMGTHGRRGAARLLFGSVAEEVVRHSPCPVLTVRERVPGGEPPHLLPRRILVPYDFSVPALAALDAAATLARAGRARLLLAHVIERPNWPELYAPLAMAEVTARREELVAEVTAHLHDLATTAAPGLQTDVEVRVGRPASEIVAIAARPDVDLVVMATRGLSGVRRMLFGSTAEEVLRLAPAPLLLVKPEMASGRGEPAAAEAVEMAGATH